MSKPQAPIGTPCGAKTRSGGKCKAPAMKNGRCRMHGGATPSGIASPHFKHGQRARRGMPERFLLKYDEALNDPELLNLRTDLALFEVRIEELLNRVGTGESKKHWEDLQKENDNARKAFANNDLGALTVALDKMDRIIGSGITDYQAWTELHQLIDLRRRTVESEQKREVAMQQIMTNEQATALMAAILHVLRTHVTDRVILAKISTELEQIATLEIRP